MKKSPKYDQAFFFEQIEKDDDMKFDYAEIQSRINTLSYEKTLPHRVPHHFSPRILALVGSLLLMGSVIGIGGFILGRRDAVLDPPSETTHEITLPPETQPSPFLPTLFPDDMLLWQGDVYIRTDLEVTDRSVGKQLGQVVSAGNQQVGRGDPHAAIASRLEDGIPFHQVIDTENYIAVQESDGYVIYQRQMIIGTSKP